MTVVDVHAHVLPRSAVDAFNNGRDWFSTSITRDLATGFPALETSGNRSSLGSLDYWIPPEDRLPHMDAAGIDIQVLSINPQLFRYNLPADVITSCARVVNDELAQTVSSFPGRFRAFAMLPLQSTAAAIEELERATQELGLSGAIVASHVNGANWDDPRLVDILEAANDLDAFIFLHPLATRIREPLPRFHMKNLIGNPTETTIAVASLIFGGAMDRFQNLRICLAHGGGYAPFGIGRFDHGFEYRPEVGATAAHTPSSYLRRFYYDSLTHSQNSLEYLVQHIGADRIVIGTDFPADMGERNPVSWLRSCDFLSNDDLNQILGATLCEALNITADEPI